MSIKHYYELKRLKPLTLNQLIYSLAILNQNDYDEYLKFENELVKIAGVFFSKCGVKDVKVYDNHIPDRWLKKSEKTQMFDWNIHHHFFRLKYRYNFLEAFFYANGKDSVDLMYDTDYSSFIFSTHIPVDTDFIDKSIFEVIYEKVER